MISKFPTFALMKQIHSLQNIQIKNILKLQEKSRERRKQGLFVIEGKREIELAIKGNYCITSLLFVSHKVSSEFITQFKEIELIEISQEVYQKIAYRESTEGVIAIAESKNTDLESLQFKNKKPLLLVIEGIEKPGNIGAMLRTADAANIDAIILADAKTDIYNPNVIRSSVGCIFTNQLIVASSEQIIRFFKNQNINQLILDLRYNIGSGGYVENIKKIAAMITGQFTDNIFLKEEWNVKAQPWFLANQPDSLLTKFPSKLNSTTTINSLNLTDVYIVLNGSNFTGSSTVELLINSLKPYINVHIIGTQTSGNNTGSITLYNSEDYNFLLRNETHTTALQPEVLRFFNKDDQTYENGFTANLSICPNEDILNLGVLGEITDPILNNVLNYISTGNNGANSNCNPNNFEFIYNSINAQREVDKGVFIKQDLPNTN